MNSSQVDKEGSNDSIIGLHVRNRLFYCHRSTLANSEQGCYFANRFSEDSKFANNPIYTDQNGLQIFFIDRDGDLFAHILQYLTRLTINLPSYHENKALWRDLRLEAEYFCLDGLTFLLAATHTCPYNEQAQGMFYWIGTERGTRGHPQYVNPLKVRGRGDNRETSVMEIQIGFLGKAGLFRDFSDTTPAFNLLQHRKKVDLNVARSHSLAPIHGNTPLWRQPSPHPLSIPLGMEPPIEDQSPAARVLKFGSISVRPTHVSIRLAQDETNTTTAFTSSLNLEASLDGSSWDRYSMAPLDGPQRSSQDMRAEIDSIVLDSRAPMLQCVNRLIDVAEHFLRKAWSVEPEPKEYYYYFRFVDGSGDYTELAGVGLELFGDIHEE